MDVDVPAKTADDIVAAARTLGVPVDDVANMLLARHFARNANPCPEGLTHRDQRQWARRSDIRRDYGIGGDLLDEYVSDNKVEAHKLVPGQNGTVVFSVQDIERVIDESPRYVPGRRKKNGVEV